MLGDCWNKSDLWRLHLPTYRTWRICCIKSWCHIPWETFRGRVLASVGWSHFGAKGPSAYIYMFCLCFYKRFLVCFINADRWILDEIWSNALIHCFSANWVLNFWNTISNMWLLQPQVTFEQVNKIFLSSEKPLLIIYFTITVSGVVIPISFDTGLPLFWFLINHMKLLIFFPGILAFIG